MLLLLGFAALFLGLQILHCRVLAHLLPDRVRKAIPWILLAFHLPLVVYMGLRVTGYAYGAGMLVRGLSRLGLYFQVVTLANLLAFAGVAWIWDVRCRWRGLLPVASGDPRRRAFLRVGAGLALGGLLVGASWGLAESRERPQVVRVELRFPDLPPGWDGIRIAHLADLHGGPLADLAQMRQWRSMLEQEKPDLLVITGDFVDSLPSEFAPFQEAFRGFRTPLGCFAILGNHDYFTDPRPIWQGLESMGFMTLENRHVLLEHGGGKLVLFGLMDPMARNGRFRGLRFGPGPMPQDVRFQMPEGVWRLGLCHRPSNWNLAREAGARLTLAGHTHGGQINLVPGLSSAKLLGPYTRGLYRDGDQFLFVTSGLGVVGLPLRIGAPPEMVILTLRQNEIPSMLSGKNPLP